MSDLARDNRIGKKTAYDYRDKGIAVLAARKPPLHTPCWRARPATRTSSSTARSSRQTG
jgi:hypothetical protein